MKTYVCDACGKVIRNPYSAKMKEFSYSTNASLGIQGFMFPKENEAKKEIDLCEDCFRNLGKLFQKNEED